MHNRYIPVYYKQLNRLAALSLGSVPRSMPTITLEVLYNLRPLDLELEYIAQKTHSRISTDPDPKTHVWDGKGVNKRDGHLKYWHQKLKQYGIDKPIDGVCLLHRRIKTKLMQVCNKKVQQNYIRWLRVHGARCYSLSS
jgi:hypothetical protein